MKFLNQGIKIIDSNEISVLRISDFNTTGLTVLDKEFGTPWHNLVKSSGVSRLVTFRDEDGDTSKQCMRGKDFGSLIVYNYLV